jgi:hypothetical protein
LNEKLGKIIPNPKPTEEPVKNDVMKLVSISLGKYAYTNKSFSPGATSPRGNTFFRGREDPTLILCVLIMIMNDHGP